MNKKKSSFYEENVVNLLGIKLIWSKSNRVVVDLVLSSRNEVVLINLLSTIMIFVFLMKKTWQNIQKGKEVGLIKFSS